jgi:uncharacterized protein (DUF2384 family)
MPALTREPLSHPDAGKILTKAVLGAADKLGVPASGLAEVLGLSAATLSRMKSGDYRLSPRKKEFELAVLFVRLFRSLDAIVGGDERVARAWLANPNLALAAKPVEKIRTISGLIDVLSYLDARRAIV